MDESMANPILGWACEEELSQIEELTVSLTR